MSFVQFECPHCQHPLEVPLGIKIGDAITCPACNRRLTLRRVKEPGPATMSTKKRRMRDSAPARITTEQGAHRKGTSMKMTARIGAILVLLIVGGVAGCGQVGGPSESEIRERFARSYPVGSGENQAPFRIVNSYTMKNIRGEKVYVYEVEAGFYQSEKQVPDAASIALFEMTFLRRGNRWASEIEIKRTIR